MNTQQWQRLETVFFEALELDPAERPRFLRQACADAPEILREVTAMLRAHEGDHALRIEGRLLEDGQVGIGATGGTGGTGEAGAPGDPEGTGEGGGSSGTRGKNGTGRMARMDVAGPDPGRDLAGRRVGAYRLIRLLGRGGMGEVWLAERADEQYRQQVAVKLLPPGYSAPEMIARFRAERQILARLVHPRIASLLDGGVTEDGLPYLVMQYVDGVPITEACAARKLGVRERLRLFHQVCETVQFAHANLVVHRDLKPSNILVNAEGIPILLDFGIAKLLDEEGFDQDAPRTRADHRLLTPEHAAPEQARGETITTATDVYGLGILLYELLTGARPFSLRGRRSTEVERIICEEEPRPPSEAVRDEAIARDALRQLRGDLDRITLMALRKDPARRYAWAGQFAEDIERYLEGKPVLAQPDTIGYRVRTFVRRNRVGVTVAVAFGLLLAAFGVVASLQAARLARERDRAQKESAKATQVVDLLVSLFQTADPVQVPGGDTLRVGEFLERSEESLAQLRGQPELLAQMWFVLGSMHTARGRFDEGRVRHERAFALLDSLGSGYEQEEAEVLHALALTHLWSGDLEQARATLRLSLEQQRLLHGPRHRDVAQAMQDLATSVEDPAERESLLVASLQMKRETAPGDGEFLASGMNALANHYFGRNRLDEALPIYREVLRRLEPLLPEDHPHLLAVRNNLAMTYSGLARTAEAESLSRLVTQAARRIHGPDSPATARALSHLSVVLATGGKFSEAESLLREAEQTFRREQPGGSVELAGTLRDLGVCVSFQGREREGQVVLQEAVEMFERTGTAPPAVLAYGRFQLALRYRNLGERDLARRLMTDAERVLRETSADGRSVFWGDALLALGEMALEDGETVEAERLFRECLEVMRTAHAEHHPRIAGAKCGLALALSASGRESEARDLLRDAWPVYAAWPLADRRIVERARAVVEAGTLP